MMKKLNMSKCLKNIFFFYQTPLFLAKESYNSNQNINDETEKHISDTLIELKKDINRKKVPENENPNKIVDIVDKKQKGKGLPRMLASRPLDLAKHIKILTPKQMLQRLPVALAEIKAGNTSENLLNEIKQIIYSVYRAK